MLKTNFIINRQANQVVMERVFNAPRKKLWEAMVDPALIPSWWGPRNYTTVLDKMDFREGGIWRFVHNDPEGNSYGFNGVYKQIVPFEKIVDTFEYEGNPGHVLQETIVLEDEGDNKTRLTSVSQYASPEDLDGMINSGMEGGATESWDRLAELVETNEEL
jgi:uncharacterized protein YndB with AHSA1/START domain